jgi:isoquinoline 1-oxidoreductase beta subunit
VASSQHGFYIESFIDELAHRAQRDPLTYRRALLKDQPRHRAALDKAAQMASWGRPLPKGRALGVAVRESFGTIVAEIAEVSIKDGEVRVHEVWCAADPGDVVNPDGFIAQMESGIIYGLTAALFGEITLEKGRVQQENFPDYEMVRLASAPEIHVEIIRSGAKIGGAGEPGTPPIAPAVTNAVFALTGKRIRALPLKNHML